MLCIKRTENLRIKKRSSPYTKVFNDKAQPSKTIWAGTNPSGHSASLSGLDIAVLVYFRVIEYIWARAGSYFFFVEKIISGFCK